MIQELVGAQIAFFDARGTRDVQFRRDSLKGLEKEILGQQDAICEALYADFKKPRFESLATETQLVLAELGHTLRNMRSWARPSPVSSPWTSFPSKEWIQREPYGKVLIIAPWNYPFMLSISPLIGALAAGNTAVIKPSEHAPNTSRIIASIIKKVFPPQYVSVVEGDAGVATELLAQKWEYIFFTGSTAVGRIVYTSAARHLTPVTLELGGKNPCIVDDTANIPLSAKRIAWGKFLNAGQTCIAPDYILVHRNAKEGLIKALGDTLTGFYGQDVERSPDYARITTEKHYRGLKAMLQGQDLILGGGFNDGDRYLEPTLVDEPAMDSALMRGEIFGPILPIISYESQADLDRYITAHEHALALYVFSKRKSFQNKIMGKYAFGGGAINDTVVQITNKHLPFGGIGGSGIGSYHGRHSFELFSHSKSIVKRGTWLDVPIRYAPYKLPVSWAKRFKHLF